MKLFKLIKSVDYVTYPTYKEVTEINKKLGDSLSNYRDVLITTAVGLFLNTTFVSNIIIDHLKKAYASVTLIGRFVRCEAASEVIALVAAIILYFLIKLIHWICYLLSTNKNTQEKRDAIVHEFFNVIIPQLVGIRSIIEKYNKASSVHSRKRILLLVQASHEISELFSDLSKMRIIEKDSKGNITKQSDELLQRIGNSTFATVLDIMVDTAQDIYKEVKTLAVSESTLSDELSSLTFIFNSNTLFPTNLGLPLFKELDRKHEQIRTGINKSNN